MERERSCFDAPFSPPQTPPCSMTTAIAEGGRDAFYLGGPADDIVEAFGGLPRTVDENASARPIDQKTKLGAIGEVFLHFRR